MKLGRALKIRTMELLRMTTSVKQLRKCGAQIGEDVIIWTNKIDKGHAFLLTIGNHVTISDARILLHDGSTQHVVEHSRVGSVIIGNNVFIGADAIILRGFPSEMMLLSERAQSSLMIFLTIRWWLGTQREYCVVTMSFAKKCVMSIKMSQYIQLCGLKNKMMKRL